MAKAAAQMMAVAVKLHAMPLPTPSVSECFDRFLAYRRVGQWITAGKW